MEKDRFRMIQDLYDTTFTINKVTQTNSNGVVTNTITVRSSGNIGKLDLLSGSKILYNEKKEVIANYVLFCDDLTIEKTDQILVNSIVYDVSMIDDSTLRGSNPHLEIYLLRQEQ